MPYSFTQIEEDKTKTIGLVFSFLLFCYFLTFFLIATIVANVVQYNNITYAARQSFEPFFLDIPTTLMILVASCAVGYGHWQYTTFNLINKILGVLGAEKLNESDTYHKMYRNILDEVSVATGGTKIEGVVIPTMAMNAFALSDFQGRNVIGVTEGVLARLNRAQIEAIVGHEAAHVVSQDCLATTVTSSLFELYSGALKGFELLLRGGAVSTRSRRRGGGGGGGGAVILAIVLIYLLLVTTRFLSQLVRMFISRQREFRADAIAVRLTRDPLSLAEALYAIAYHWRGQGLTAEELEAIFIINPKYAYLDEHEGSFANLFSTHPPVEKRLDILMNMAHTDLEQIVAGVKKLENRPRSTVPKAEEADKEWMVHRDGKWQGPFALVQMATFDWITPDTWINRMDQDDVQMVHQDVLLTKMINNDKVEGGDHKDKCPKCKLPLSQINYEGVEIEQCSFCNGVLVQERDIQRIIIRSNVGFSDEVRKIAAGIKEEGDLFTKLKINRDPDTLLKCPKCNHPKERMHRNFYTTTYRVEIDRCFACGSVWFDADELEVLQCLIEGATQPQ